MSATEEDELVHETFEAGDARSSSPASSLSATTYPTMSPSIAKAKPVDNISATNISLRLMADAASATSASLLVAPIVTTIDRYRPSRHLNFDH